MMQPEPTRRRATNRRLNAASLITMAALAGLLAGIAGCPQLFPPADQSDGDQEQLVSRIAVEEVASGLTSPVTVVPSPDDSGRLFIVDQVGVIRILDGQGGLLDTPFLDLRGEIVELMSGFDERGLLGLAFHPDFARNRRFFVFYTAPKGPEVPAEFNSETHISEFLVSETDANRADPSSERLLLTVAKPQFNHNGGTLAFSPDDGFLYISLGDGGGAHDIGFGHTDGIGNAQDLTKRLGSILRIDVDSGEPFGIPADNPFVDDAAAADEIWAYGLRNAYRMSFDAGGDHRLFVGDAGQNLREEVNIITRGGNYGWNIKEGFSCFDPENPNDPPAMCADQGPNGNPLIDPILDYPHPDGVSGPRGVVVIGGFIYRGAAIPGLAGEYVFGDFSRSNMLADGSLFAARERSDGSWSMRELEIDGSETGRLGRFILGFGQDRDGEMYVCTTMNTGPTGETGAVLRIVPAQ